MLCEYNINMSDLINGTAYILMKKHTDVKYGNMIWFQNYLIIDI